MWLGWDECSFVRDRSFELLVAKALAKVGNNTFRLVKTYQTHPVQGSWVGRVQPVLLAFACHTATYQGALHALQESASRPKALPETQFSGRFQKVTETLCRARTPSFSSKACNKVASFGAWVWLIVHFGPDIATEISRPGRSIMDYYFQHRFLYGIAMLLARSWVLVVSIGVSALFLAIAYVIIVARYAKQLSDCM